MKRRKRLGCLARLLLLSLMLASIVGVLVWAWCAHAFRDRNPGYEVNLDLSAEPSRAEPRPLRAGFGRVKVNPDVRRPDRPVYLAGFDRNRVATGIHDDLWAIALVLDDGYTRLGIVAVDAIGFFHDDVVAIRRRLETDWRLDYTIVCATHNHSTPDLMGLWGPDYLHTGVDPCYRQSVLAASAEALGTAVTALRTVRLKVRELAAPTEGLVADTRKPEVFDPDIRVMHFTDRESGATLGSLVAWADHPETVWSANKEITSDFCGYLRDALAEGVTVDGQVLAEGVGGIHLYINGAIGGLISTTPSVSVRDPYLERDFKEPSHEKARAQGRRLARLILPLLRSDPESGATEAPIGIRARTLELPLDNKLFLLASALGVIDRGQPRWRTLRTEIAVVEVGDASIACVPGEIYPELVNGGIEKAPGADFDVDPIEVPPLREMMSGRIKFVFGLANDEIGYIIPKSEWDAQPPYLYGAENTVYGEMNSAGPDTARLIHAAFKDLLEVNK